MTSTDGVEALIRKVTLLNAVKHDGKAELNAVIGKVLAEKPDLKGRVKEVSRLASLIVDEVNKLAAPEQRKIVEGSWPELLLETPRVKEKVLPPLPNADKYSEIRTRFSPNPDCVLHLGSVRAVILSHDYARHYKGKFLLRFEDTDPRQKKAVLGYYDAIREDLTWLGCKWDEEVIQSDRLPIYYEHASKLIDKGAAYVCTCQKEAFLSLILAFKPCPCREAGNQGQRWVKMLEGGYREGEAVVRVKTDLNHPNPAVRDWPALRIIDTERSPHPRVGSRYRVWPLYNYAAGLDDHLMGITHIIRGKEHVTNMVRQEFMYEHLGWRYPEAIHYGKLRIQGATLSKSRILKAYNEGFVQDLSDPRLPTLQAIRRRGFSPESLRRVVNEVGIRPVDAMLSWENIFAYNRKILDGSANRYFFVPDPIQMTVKDLKKPYRARLLLHPGQPERGARTLEVTPSAGDARLLIPRADAEACSPGKVVRLIELFNVQLLSIEEDRVITSLHSEDYEVAKKIEAPLIQWLPAARNIRVEVVMPNAQAKSGLGEDALLNEKIGNVVQLMRFGFGRIDESGGDRVRIYYAHN